MSKPDFSMEQAEDDPNVSHSWDDDKHIQKDDDPGESAGWDKDKKKDQDQARRSGTANG